MRNVNCFGQGYDNTCRECKDLCKVTQDCRLIMEGRIVDNSKLPCFGEYEEDSYACKTACHSKDLCKIATVAREGLTEDEVKDEVSEVGAVAEEAVVIEPIASPTVERVAVKPQRVSVPAVPEAIVPEAIVPEAIVPEAIVPEAIVPEAVEPEAVEPEAVEPEAVEPEAVEPKAVKPGKKPVKKNIVRELLYTEKGASIEEMLDALVESGAIENTDEDRKKSRSLISSWFSEFRRIGHTITQQGDNYVGRIE